MIITKKDDHILIEADEVDDHIVSFRDEPPKTLCLTEDGWVALRHLTPEARALRELVEALEGSDEQHRDMIRRALGFSPELASALQEARVLVRRMGATPNA